MTLIRRNEESAHWYLKNGTPFFETQYADPKRAGQLRPVTISDAFKAGALRSVTSVMKIMAKPELTYWIQEQTILAALTLPKLPDEDLDSYAFRVIEDAKTQTRKAADAGVAIHAACSEWMLKQRAPAPELAATVAPFQAWFAENVDEGGLIASEVVALNLREYYAGTLDLAVRLKDKSIALVDMKTQDVKVDKKTAVLKPAFYDEWEMQLAAYSRCQFSDGSYVPPFPWRLISLVVDRTRPGVYAKEWTTKENPQASSENAYQGFIAACRLWSHMKGGTPGKDLKAV